jgi:signal transduction histidine kinase
VEGMGVGMYIVKSIVDSHGGKIEVKSKPKRGALFKVYFKN